ncbi:MAG: ribonuclease Z [Spirochaetaceae bacterium]|nr:ribonuclease Z [Spirochaetaceae bacterium]
MNLEAFILGCGGMMPLPNRHLTSVLLRREGELFLFDAGEGTQVALRKLNLKWKKITAIFISHTHADHITGLPGILMLSSQVDRDEPLYIFGPPKVRAFIESCRQILDMYINYEIVVHDIVEEEEIFSRQDFRIRCFKLEHTKPCFGYTLEEKPRPGKFSPDLAKKYNVPMGPLWAKLQTGEDVKNDAGTLVKSSDVVGPLRKGRKFSYVTDTLYLDSIAGEVKDSDLFVCEAMFAKGLEADAKEKKHMTCTQAATIARDAKVKKMALIHYSPRYTKADLHQNLADAQMVFPHTILSKDGLVLPIEYEET